MFSTIFLPHVVSNFFFYLFIRPRLSENGSDFKSPLYYSFMKKGKTRSANLLLLNKKENNNPFSAAVVVEGTFKTSDP